MAAPAPRQFVEDYIHAFARDFDFSSRVSYRIDDCTLLVQFKDESVTPAKVVGCAITQESIEAGDLTILNAHLNQLVRALC